jgi:hypothetical protein
VTPSGSSEPAALAAVRSPSGAGQETCAERYGQIEGKARFPAPCLFFMATPDGAGPDLAGPGHGTHRHGFHRLATRQITY